MSTDREIDKGDVIHIYHGILLGHQKGTPADERINIPAVPRHYWRYRMHCTLETLVADDKLNAHLRTLVGAASRNH